MGVGTISGTSQTGFVKIGASQSYGPNKSLLRVPIAIEIKQEHKHAKK